MRRYRFSVELTPLDGGVGVPADVQKRVYEQAPWALGTFMILVLAAHKGDNTPRSAEEFCATTMAGWKNVDVELCAMAFDKLHELGCMEVIYLN